MSGDVVAWVSPLRHGSQVTFLKPNPPEEWDDAFDDWYCYGLVKASDYAALQAKLDAVTKERDALRSALNPQQWTSEMSTAWHLNIPDLQKSFDELTNAALTDQGRAGEAT